MSEPIRVVRAAELEGGPHARNASAAGVREADLWAGQVETEPGSVSGWHHHDVNETSICVVSGVMRLECEGVDGYVEAHPGDFVSVPAHTVHRESNPGSEPCVAILARAGGGVPTVNVDAPPATG